MDEYFRAKSLLFKKLSNKARAVINWDDPKGKDLEKLTDAKVVRYGLGKDCDIRAEDVHSSRNGLTAELKTPAGQIKIRSSLIGGFNIYNILAATAAALCMDIDPGAIESGISRIKGVPGRLELVKNKRSLSILVDYAHTPDALSKALEAIRPLAKGGRIITVFGCGGDRDKGKRREMGHAAGKRSDLVVVTSDNPRSEAPDAIIAQIEKGVITSGMKKLDALQSHGLTEPGYILDPDRGMAIRKAVEAAHEQDIVLIAGKGHEDYQIIGKNKRHFDDREVAADAAS
jgi:UDP-N-acetylmuramoyl-L-alanyl-D-glutamate--2,6-diaminopimelate ligase